MAASEPAPPAPVRGEPGGGRGAGGGAGPRARPRGGRKAPSGAAGNPSCCRLGWEAAPTLPRLPPLAPPPPPPPPLPPPPAPAPPPPLARTANVGGAARGMGVASLCRIAWRGRPSPCGLPQPVSRREAPVLASRQLAPPGTGPAWMSPGRLPPAPYRTCPLSPRRGLRGCPPEALGPELQPELTGRPCFRSSEQEGRAPAPLGCGAAVFVRRGTRSPGRPRPPPPPARQPAGPSPPSPSPSSPR